MLDWLKRKAAEKQEANFSASLSRLISASNEAYGRIEFTGDSTWQQKKAIQELQSSLAYDFAGPLNPDELKQRLIDPALAAPAVTEGARIAVMHVYESVVKMRG